MMRRRGKVRGATLAALHDCRLRGEQAEVLARLRSLEEQVRELERRIAENAAPGHGWANGLMVTELDRNGEEVVVGIVTVDEGGDRGISS